jgi:hypothetical protein
VQKDTADTSIAAGPCCTVRQPTAEPTPSLHLGLLMPADAPPLVLPRPAGHTPCVRHSAAAAQRVPPGQRQRRSGLPGGHSQPHAKLPRAIRVCQVVPRQELPGRHRGAAECTGCLCLPAAQGECWLCCLLHCCSSRKDGLCGFRAGDHCGCCWQLCAGLDNTQGDACAGAGYTAAV